MSEDKNNPKGAKFWQNVRFEEKGIPKFPEFRGEDTLEEIEQAFDDVPEKEVANVQFSMGRTVNLGNFNTVKFNVGVSLPCHVTEIEDCYKAAKSFLKPKFDRLESYFENNKSDNAGKGTINKDVDIP